MKEQEAEGKAEEKMKQEDSEEEEEEHKARTRKNKNEGGGGGGGGGGGPQNIGCFHFHLFKAFKPGLYGGFIMLGKSLYIVYEKDTPRANSHP